MTTMPSGKVRPPIDPPILYEEDASGTPTTVRRVMLTDYRFCDESRYTHEEFDYRLRWTLEVKHMSMDSSRGRNGTRGSGHVTVEVWSRRDAEWHHVWEVSREVISPYSTVAFDVDKANDWNGLLAEVAEYVTKVLL